MLGYTVGHDDRPIWQSERGGTNGAGARASTPSRLWVVSGNPDEAPDPSTLRVRTRVNGDGADGNTSDMTSLWQSRPPNSPWTRPCCLVRYCSRGPREGIGWACNPKRTLHAGDTVEVVIDGAALNQKDPRADPQRSCSTASSSSDRSGSGRWTGRPRHRVAP